ncbi:MAG: hypothetical protein ABNH32_12510 [Marinobacter sp.]
MVKMEDLFAHDVIFEKHRTPGSRLQRILVIRDGPTLRSGHGFCPGSSLLPRRTTLVKLAIFHGDFLQDFHRRGAQKQLRGATALPSASRTYRSIVMK